MVKTGRWAGWALFAVALMLAVGSRGLLEAEDSQGLSELKAVVAAQGDFIKEQAKVIEGLQQDVADLKGKQLTVTPTETELGALLDKKIAEKKLDTKKGIFAEGVPSLKGEWWKLGGKLEFEFLDTEADRSGLDKATTSDRERGGASAFQVDKLVLIPEVLFNEDVTFRAVIEFAGQADGTENTVNVNDAYLTWKHFLEYVFLPKDPTNTWIMVGDFDYFEKTWGPGKRKTENFDLVSGPWYEDDDLGIRLGGDLKLHPLLAPFWYVQLSNGNRIDDRSIQDRSGAFEMLVYDENNLDFNNNKMWRGGVGNSMDLAQLGKVDVLGWASTQDLDLNNDIVMGKIGATAGFAAAFPDPELNADIYGVIGSYTLGNFQLEAQFAKGPISNLDMDSYEIRPSYKIKLPGVEKGGRKFFTGAELLYSYSQYQLKNLPAVTTDARTWDRVKHIFAVLFDVTKNVVLKVEYAVNDEKTGGEKVDNNEFLTQLEIAW